MAPDRRNVLFVVLDTVRKDHLTPYGGDRATTPTLDRFADEALVYEEAVTQAPWTLPAHASMFTGRYPSGHGATQESPYLPPGIGTLAEALSTAGYRSACYTSNAWITPYTRLTAGFDEHDSFFDALPGGELPSPAAALWRGLTAGRLRPFADRLVELGNVVHESLATTDRGSKTPAVLDQTREFIATTNEPWFAFVNLMDAHLPYYPPEPYRAALAPTVDPDSVCQNAKAYNAGARSISEREFESIRRLYDAELRHVDDALGRLFGWLQQFGEWEETVVIVCADHGELHGEFDLYGHEFAVYEPLVNVPLLIKHPDLGAGRSREPVELLDLYDTVLESAAATDGPDRVGGRPFESERSLLTDGKEIPGGEFGFVEYHRPMIERRQLETKAERAGVSIETASRFDSRRCAVRHPDGKYIANERFEDELYRLDSGLLEGQPLEADSELGVELSDALDRFAARVDSACIADGRTEDRLDDTQPATVAEMGSAAKRRLRELGYL